MLNQSNFNNNYEITRTFKSGLLMGNLTSNLDLILRTIIGKKITSYILKHDLKVNHEPLFKLHKFDGGFLRFAKL